MFTATGVQQANGSIGLSAKSHTFSDIIWTKMFFFSCAMVITLLYRVNWWVLVGCLYSWRAYHFL